MRDSFSVQLFGTFFVVCTNTWYVFSSYEVTFRKNWDEATNERMRSLVRLL